MKKVSLDTWIQLIGLLSVLGGLVFVGLQMQQTQRIAIAGQVQARAEILANRYVALMEGEAETMSVTFDGKDQGEKADFLRRQQIGWNIAIMTNTFYQFNAGLLTEEQFEVSKKRVVALKANCELREEIDAALFFAEDSFIAYFESLPDPCAT